MLVKPGLDYFMDQRCISITYLSLVVKDTLINWLEHFISVSNPVFIYQKIPFHFRNVSITRKMHIWGSVVNPIINNDKSDKVRYKY